MKLIQVFTASVMLAISLTGHAEHQACYDIEYAYIEKNAAELRDIAKSCKQENIAQLYYNRAYYIDLITEDMVLANLLPHTETNITVQAYAMYILIIEQLASNWFPNEQTRINFLNIVYQRNTEIAELRLHGYDNLADRLEQQAKTESIIKNLR